MSAQETSRSNPRDPPSTPPFESPAEGPGLFDILSGWWRDRTWIVLLALAGLVAAAGVVFIASLKRTSQQEATMTIRLLFKGVEDGQYPNGTRFTPADIVATPVMQEVYRRNHLEKFIKFDDFKNAIAVTSSNPALDRLRREYGAQLDARNLSAVDRNKLEDDYDAKMKALKNGEFTLVALLGGRFSSWPASLTGKVVDDILNVWAEQSRDRGVFKFDLNIYSGNILSDLKPAKDDYLILLDRLRITVNRILSNLDDLAAIPGANMVRAGDKQLSIGELQVTLQDDLRFKLGTIEAPVYAMGLYGNRTLAEAYLHEQIFRLQLEHREVQSQADAVAHALANYSASRAGMTSMENAGAAGTSAPMGGGGTLIPQISESFLDRVLDLSSQNADVAFRQQLSKQTIDIERHLGEIESEQQTYERMLKSVGQHDAATDAQREEIKKWVEQQVSALLPSLKENLQYVQLLYDQISQQNLQPSVVYSVIVPLRQDRISVVSLRRIGLIAALAYAAYLGAVLVILAWKTQAATAKD